jgi:hypothetical protein
MRRPILVALLFIFALPLTAQAQFKSYFDISALKIAPLTEPDWSRKQEGDRVRYLCTNFERCALPTAIEIKGVVRAETLPEAFETGALTPARLRQDGENNAKRTNSRFLLAEPVTIEGRKGVHMEASADLNGTIYFVTRWIGQGDRMLDVKVTARDLKLARELSDTAARSLVPQVFGN